MVHLKISLALKLVRQAHGAHLMGCEAACVDIERKPNAILYNVVYIKDGIQVQVTVCLITSLLYSCMQGDISVLH